MRDTIKRLKTNILNTEKEIQSLRPSNIPEGYLLNYEISSDLADATEKAKDRVFDNMVSLLEKYANEHFQSLIKYNDLAGGILKFEKSPSGSILFNYNPLGVIIWRKINWLDIGQDTEFQYLEVAKQTNIYDKYS